LAQGALAGSFSGLHPSLRLKFVAATRLKSGIVALPYPPAPRMRAPPPAVSSRSREPPQEIRESGEVEPPPAHRRAASPALVAAARVGRQIPDTRMRRDALRPTRGSRIVNVTGRDGSDWTPTEPACASTMLRTM
jgi:hypothetical protein